MRYDQACRFSSTESGYKIIARSDGFNENSAKNMTDAFNDTLNRLFGKMGQSAVSLTKSGNEIFFAKLTLRSDVKGRRTLFTNAVAIPVKVCRQALQKNPGWLMNLPYTDLISQQPSVQQMEKMEILDTAMDPESIEARIRQEFRLISQTAFTEFIRLVYEAVTTGSAVCLDTNIAPDATPELVIRYATLISLVLPKSLRQSITFSSLGDTRNMICVNSRGNGELLTTGKKVIHFPADPDDNREFDNGEKKVGIQNGFKTMLNNFANELAKRNYSERQTFLSEIEYFANELSGTEMGCISSALLIIAYYIYKDDDNDFNTLSKFEAVYLLHALLGYLDRKNDCNAKNANCVLMYLANRMAKEQICPSINQLAPLTVRALTQNDKDLFESVFRLLDYAAAETRTNLAAIILEQKYSTKQHEIVNKLLIENPISWDNELLSNLFAWSCQNNILNLVDEIWSRRNSNAVSLIHRLIGDNKKQEEGILILQVGESLFNDAEMAYMTKGLLELCDDAEGQLSKQSELNEQEEQQILDHYTEFTQCFKEAWIRYLKVFKLGDNNSESDNIENLKMLKAGYPEIYIDLESALLTGTFRERKLFEDFLIVTEFSNCISISDVKDLCEKYNIEKNPESVLEKKAVELWLKFSEYLTVGKFSENFDNYISSNINKLENVELSEESKTYLREQLIERFWSNNSCKDIIDAFFEDDDMEATVDKIDNMSISLSPEMIKKRGLYKSFARAKKSPEDKNTHTFFRNVAEAGKDEEIKLFESKYFFTTDERKNILLGIKELGIRLFYEDNLFIIDYLLAGTYQLDEKKPDKSHYNLEEFCDCVYDLAENGQHVKVDCTNSVILYGDEADQKVRKELRTSIMDEDPVVLLELKDQLKNKWKPLEIFKRKKGK